eukprot:scaffold223900_cov24-Tisochrysis_lutea.AAC.1
MESVKAERETCKQFPVCSSDAGSCSNTCVCVEFKRNEHEGGLPAKLMYHGKPYTSESLCWTPSSVHEGKTQQSTQTLFLYAGGDGIVSLEASWRGMWA